MFENTYFNSFFLDTEFKAAKLWAEHVVLLLENRLRNSSLEKCEIDLALTERHVRNSLIKGDIPSPHQLWINSHHFCYSNSQWFCSLWSPAFVSLQQP